MTEFANLPAWTTQLLWTVATLAGSWVMGRVVGVSLLGRMTGWVPKDQQVWAHATVDVVLPIRTIAYRDEPGTTREGLDRSA